MYLFSCNFTSATLNMSYISDCQIVVRNSCSSITLAKLFWETISTRTGNTSIHRTFRRYHCPKCLHVYSDSKMKALRFFETSVTINE